jgi:hypothetical protein
MMNTNATSVPGDIARWSEKLSDEFEYAATHFKKEMELREHVHHHILAALKSLYALDFTASVGEFNTQKNGSQSPLDRLYGGVVVEWEWDMKPSRREHGAQQALDYLANTREHFASVGAYTAIVSDGRQ